MRKHVSPFLAASVVTALVALPAWGAPGKKTVPLFGNVAIVAVNGGANLVMGMAQVATFSSPVTAMEQLATWCGTPAADNPCLVKILPGVYDLAGATLTMQPYVDVEGSGETTTVITSAFGSSTPAGVVNGADNAEIRLLTVENTGTTGTYVAAIANNSQSPKITHVTATATGGAFASGVHNVSSSPTMSHVTATATGAGTASGVYNVSSSPVMNSVTATGVDGGVNAYGVYNTAASAPAMNDVTATALRGHFSYGVGNEGASAPTMSNVTASATGGTNVYGVQNLGSSSAVMTNVTVTAVNGTNVYGVDNRDSSPTMSNVTVSASGGTGNFGVRNSGSSAPTLTNVSAIAKGVNSIGLGNSLNSTVTISVDRSTFVGASSSVSNGSNVTLRIGASKLAGPVFNSGTLTCVVSYNDSYVALGTDCQ